MWGLIWKETKPSGAALKRKHWQHNKYLCKKTCPHEQVNKADVKIDGTTNPGRTCLSKDTTDRLISILWNSPFAVHMGSIQSLSNGSRYGSCMVLCRSVWCPSSTWRNHRRFCLDNFSSHSTTGAHPQISNSVHFFKFLICRLKTVNCTCFLTVTAAWVVHEV